MKRAFAITLTVAMIGGLMFMGFAGTAAAQNDVDQTIDQEIGDLDATQEQDLQTGDAEVNVDVAQDNVNVQQATTTSGDALGANGQAASLAETNQDQNVNQVNNADVDATAETGDIDATQDLTQEPTQEAEQDAEVVDEGDDIDEATFNVDIDLGDFNGNGD